MKLYDCIIKWKDDNSTEQVVIAVGNYVKGETPESLDNLIFFYIESESDLGYMLVNGCPNEEFTILSYKLQPTNKMTFTVEIEFDNDINEAGLTKEHVSEQILNALENHVHYSETGIVGTHTENIFTKKVSVSFGDISNTRKIFDEI